MPTHLQRKGDSAYLQLLERITIGFWKVGETIPGELQLASQFKCSRGTIGKALTRLADEGFVERKMRTGTRVVRDAPALSETQIHFEALAFIYPNLRQDKIWRTVTGFSNAALEGGQRTMLLTMGGGHKDAIELVAGLNDLKVQGAIFYLIIETPEEQTLVSQALLQATFPLVLACANLPGMNLPAALAHQVDAGYTMTKYLLSRGAHRIGFYARAQSTEVCYGYQWALEESGITFEERLVALENAGGDNLAKIEDYLGLRRDLQGVVCGDDQLAEQMVEAAGNMGIRVPQDLMIAGISDSSNPSAAFIATYRVPYEEIGRRAYSLLLALIRSGSSPLESRVIGQLVTHDSA
jgi:GntR family transcriptional regulator of arabinose operon